MNDRYLKKCKYFEKIERKRERGRETDRQRETDTETQRERQSDRQTERQTDGRTQNSELYYSRIKILGSCLFLQSVPAITI